jgi:hypothetical protein
MASARVIKWMKFREADDDTAIAWIDVAKVNALWHASMPDAYLEQGTGRRETFQYLRNAVEGGAILRMPHLQLLHIPHRSAHSDARATRSATVHINFLDGRHRFAWARDHGASSMPVAIERNEAELVDRFMLAPRGPHVTKVKV